MDETARVRRGRALSAAVIRPMLVILLAVLTGGCLDADVAIRFTDANHGELREHITLSDRLLQANSDAVDRWTSELQQRVHRLGGTTRVGDNELTLALPFYNTRDLEEKFNQLIGAAPAAESDSITSATPQPRMHLSASRDFNLIVAQRNRLRLEADLRSLRQASGESVQLRHLDTTLAGKLRLSAPREITVMPPSSAASVSTDTANTLTWDLDSSQPTQLDVAFWVPSPLGIGGTVIAVLTVAGALIRTILFPNA